MKKVGVLISHGMGNHDKAYAEDFILLVSRELNKLGMNADEVEIEAAHWQDQTQKKQQDLWKKVNYKFDLDFVKLRQFVLNAFGDAIGYLGTPTAPSDLYPKIHADIHKSIQTLESRLDPDSPIILVASSLGTAIFSNYVWDRQKLYGSPDPLGQTEIQRMKTLSGFITFGSNIPLFTIQFNAEDIKAINFPPSTLNPSLKSAAKWYNYYDRDDILGYPLKELSPSYKSSVNLDIEVNAGGIVTGWNPMSHLAYWKDKDIIKPVANLIRKIHTAAQ